MGRLFPNHLRSLRTVDPVSLKWLLDHGADPNCARAARKYPGSALDQVIASYSRSPQLGACIEILMKARAITTYNIPPVLDILYGRVDRLTQHVDADPALIDRFFLELDIGQTGGRALDLQGATLLHVAAENGNVDATELLLDRGADPNHRAIIDENGVGGQTPIFHAATQFGEWGFRVVQLLIERGADLSIRVKLPGHYDKPGEVVECTPLEYATLFPGDRNRVTELMRHAGSSGRVPVR